jgi:hypothetical protein
MNPVIKDWRNKRVWVIGASTGVAMFHFAKQLHDEPHLGGKVCFQWIYSDRPVSSNGPAPSCMGVTTEIVVGFVQ